MTIGISGPLGGGIKRSTFGDQEVKIKVTRGKRWVWRSGGGIILAVLDQVGFLVKNKMCKIYVVTHLQIVIQPLFMNRSISSVCVWCWPCFFLVFCTCRLASFMTLPGQVGRQRHYILSCSICPSVRSSICLSITKLVNTIF